FRVMISPRSSHDLFERGMDSIASENVCYPAKLVHGHVEALLAKGVRTIFYPAVQFEQQLVTESDKNFNCPVVAFYPQVIATNLEGVRADGVRFLYPYLNLADPTTLARRLVEVFADWGVTADEATAAVEAGYAEDARFRADIRERARQARQECRERGVRGIVLAGRPYHVDPEVNHGIPEMINTLGMAVFTEESVIDESASVLQRPLRVRDQWAYHTRLYEAAAVVAEDPTLELVQLNSFGCGLDAITSDQVAEILAAKDGVHTLLKIDEISSLGAARIRLRSLAAAADERATFLGMPRMPAPVNPVEPPAERAVFTKEMKAAHTIIAPQMAPVQFSIVEPVLRKHGYQVKVLRHASNDDVEAGLTTVNNDACYPAIMVVGQLVNAFVTGAEDPDSTSVLITQTGGMCRATNYTGMLRRALRDAGFSQVPVLAISTSNIESNPGFSLTPGLLREAVRAIVLGDLLQALLLRVRPYEAETGSAGRLYDRWDAVCREWVQTGKSETYGSRVRYASLVHAMVEEFDALPLRDVPRRPRVGIVGEILVKFHPDANNNIVDVIESEGCEAVLPGMFDFLVTGLYQAQWNRDNLGTESWLRTKKFIARYLEGLRRPVRRALTRTNTQHPEPKFVVPAHPAHLATRAQSVTSLGNQAGEGWLLAAEVLELIDLGVPNVACVQPFACLPNHVVGKGMFAEIRRQHPGANLVAIDYDPGASQVNQLNRIKLMIATAHLVADTPSTPSADEPEPRLATQH
ncbi:MAG: acyl-CoA dehydratase activase-related protein, partial [Cellulomonas sp.]|nr:acyl-CoA dehydratase activase-related protein [Cellulomonas sp.]